MVFWCQWWQCPPLESVHELYDMAVTSLIPAADSFNRSTVSECISLSLVYVCTCVCVWVGGLVMGVSQVG